jgi:hypothetical protein
MRVTVVHRNGRGTAKKQWLIGNASSDDLALAWLQRMLANQALCDQGREQMLHCKKILRSPFRMP